MQLDYFSSATIERKRRDSGGRERERERDGERDEQSENGKDMSESERHTDRNVKGTRIGMLKRAVSPPRGKGKRSDRGETSFVIPSLPQ